VERPRAEEWLQKIEAWRPRRPTLILLDDPRLDDAKPVIDALSDHRRVLCPMSLFPEPPPAITPDRHQLDETGATGCLGGLPLPRGGDRLP
jgi:hypothetical protein